MKRKALVTLLILVALGAIGAQGKPWPSKPIEIVVPFGAGGDTDFHARTYAKYLKDILGQPVVVVNVAGANGSIGSIKVRDAKPDGYTALFFHDSMLMNKVVGVADFAQEAFSVCAIGVYDNSYILAVNSKSPYKTLADFVEGAKKNPGRLIWATQIGGSTYLGGVLLEQAAGVKFNMVDAGGGAERNAALLAGKVDANFNPYGVMKPYIDSGDFRVLAVFSEKRSGLFPNVPTAKEQGYDIIFNRAYFLSFPKGTDPAIVQKMSDAMAKVSANPQYGKDIEKAYNVEPGYGDTQTALSYLDSTMARFMKYRDLILGKSK